MGCGTTAARETGCLSERMLVLRPNNGLYWRTTLWVYLAIVAVCSSIAVGFALVGFWPILPFAGMELTALGTALYVSARRGRYREVIRVDDVRVRIEKGRRGPDQSWQFNRAWCEVRLLPPPGVLAHGRLLLTSQGVGVELGAFLTDDDRTAVAGKLRVLIGPMGRADRLPDAP